MSKNDPETIAKLLRDFNTNTVIEMAGKAVFIDKLPLEKSGLFVPTSLGTMDVLPGFMVAVKQVIEEEIAFLDKLFDEECDE